MFKLGMFSSDPNQPFQVDALGLRKMTEQHLARGLQVTEANPMAGLEGRTGLLSRLAAALGNAEYFGASARPGNMLGRKPLLFKYLYIWTN